MGKIVEYGEQPTVAPLISTAPVVRGSARGVGTEARNIAASATSTPAGTLSKLAEDQQEEVRQSVAYNRKTPSAVLDKLASDPCPSIRRAVASNEKARPATLKKLAQDDDASVLRSLSWNQRTPPGVLQELAGRADEAPKMPWDRISPDDPNHAPMKNFQTVADVPWGSSAR